MEKVKFTDREEKIAEATDLSEFTDEELGAFYRKDCQRIREMCRGEFKEYTRIHQCSMLNEILSTFISDCQRLYTTGPCNKKRIEAKRVQNHFKDIQLQIYPLFRRMAKIANWKKDLD